MLGPGDLQGEVLATFRRDVYPILYDGLLSRLQDAGYRFRGVREVGGPNRRDLVVAAALGVGVAIGPFSAREVEAAEAEPMVICRTSCSPGARRRRGSFGPRSPLRAMWHAGSAKRRPAQTPARRNRQTHDPASWALTGPVARPYSSSPRRMPSATAAARSATPSFP